MTPPTVLAIAGSDSGGGAGIQADLKAFAATGVHGATAITSVTSQHTRGVERVDPLPIDGVTGQIEAVFDDFDVQAVKTGMLHSPLVVERVADALKDREVPVVVDPVMVATSGDALMEENLEEALQRLAATTTLVTPNRVELKKLTGVSIQTSEDVERATDAMLEQGWNAVLAKGGHADADPVVDVFATGKERAEITYPRIDASFHGAGCTYSSLIAGLMARGHELGQAVHEARARMQRALERAYRPGGGPRVLDALETHQPGPPEGAPLSQAAWRLAALLPRGLVPEVGTNMAYVPGRARDPEQMLGLSRRITRTRDGTTPPGPVTQGGSSHVARALLAARDVNPDLRAAANLAYREDLLDTARETGLIVARFDREKEPEEASSTMAWGTTRALKRTPDADLVVDEGAKGKEPMSRVLATSTSRLVEKVKSVINELDG